MIYFDFIFHLLNQKASLLKFPLFCRKLFKSEVSLLRIKEKNQSGCKIETLNKKKAKFFLKKIKTFLNVLLLLL